MNSEESNDIAQQEVEKFERKVNLHKGYSHSQIFGSPRRCMNRHCMEAFTPYKRCPSCNSLTKSLKSLKN